MAKKFYITTSIPYTNAPPHIGFALEVIQADVLARYYRLKKRDVFYLAGTDEHGLKIRRSAEEAGKTPEEFSDMMSEKFKDLKAALNLSYDDFIRTTDKNRHFPSVTKLWETILARGDFYKKRYKGFYCPGCEAFKTEKEMIDGKCVIHQKATEEIEEENYFFKLSKYLPKIREIIEKEKIKIFPKIKKNEILKMIDGGLEDVSFSRARNKYWGISVPGDQSQIVYVWADALPNYISAAGYADDEKKFKRYWPADVHCIGKDIVKFHAIYWPAMLLSLRLKLPKTIFIHGFITVNGQKMSKSLGNVIDPRGLTDKYGADATRYYLLREIAPMEDGDFSYEKFEQRYSADLSGGIGNLLARTVSLANKNSFILKKSSLMIRGEIKKTKKEYENFLKEFKFNESLKSVWKLIGFCDKYINREKPWEERDNFSQVVSDILFALDKISILLSPIMPESSEKIKNAVIEKKSVILFPKLK